MVKGMEKFREYLAGHEDKYAVIGGAACVQVFGHYGAYFRGSEDIDMVLCVEVVDAEFGAVIGKFLKDGGYRNNEHQSDGKKQFYRFQRPTDDDFPTMIELFSRRDGTLELPEDVKLTRIPVEDGAISLSAILLDEIYYEELVKKKRQEDGVTIIDQELLIPFKALAYLNLSEEGGTSKREKKDIEKHLYDVFNLAQLLSRERKIDVPDKLKEDLRGFLDKVESEGSIDVENSAWTSSMSLEEAFKLLRSTYSL